MRSNPAFERSAAAQPKTLRSNYVGDILEAEKLDAGDLDAVIEALGKRVNLIKDLALEPLSENELAKRISDLRAVPLPAIKPRRFSREDSFHGFKEVAV